MTIKEGANLHSITLGRILLDGTYSVGLQSALDDARLATGLNEIGLAARLYSGKPEGRVIDVVRQLVRMRTDAYLFWVSDEISAATCKLAQGILNLRPDARILFWARDQAESLQDRAQLEALGTLVFAATPEAMIATMLSTITPRNDVDGAKIRLSPYLSGLLSAEDVSRYGLTIHQPLDSLRDEIHWLAKQHVFAATVVPIFGWDSTEASLIECCEIVGGSGIGRPLELHASAQKVTQAVLDAMSLNRISRLVVSDDASLLSLKPSEYGVELVSKGNSKRELQTKRKTYGRNGMFSLHVGIYPDVNVSPAVQHFEVPLGMDAEDRRRAYEWVAPNLAMRSAVVLRGSINNVVEHLPSLHAPANIETHGWPKHSYAIGLAEDSNAAQVSFDGEAETKQDIQYVPLAELDGAVDTPGSMTFITMNTENDLVELVRLLEVFHSRGVLDVKFPRRSILFENSCRWMSYGACRLLSLRRLQLVGTDKLTACRDSGDVGHVGDAFDSIVTVLKQRQQIEGVRRECATCPVRDQCSQCVHLPATWGGRYCDIRKSYPQSGLFFALVSFTQIVCEHIEVKEQNLELRISYTGLPQQYYKSKLGPTKQGQRPVIASVLGQTLAWWPGTRKLIRLSPPLALMAEAWWSSAFEADITRELSQTFNVDAATAVSSLTQGCEKLRAEGIIHA